MDNPIDNPDFFQQLFSLIGQLYKQKLITNAEKSLIKGSTIYLVKIRLCKVVTEIS